MLAFILKAFVGIILIVLGIAVIVMAVQGFSTAMFWMFAVPAMIGIIGYERVCGWMGIDSEMLMGIMLLPFVGSGIIAGIFDWERLPCFIQGVAFLEMGFLLLGALSIPLFMQISAFLLETVAVFMIPILLPIILFLLLIAV